jgi:hypothetical protein
MGLVDANGIPTSNAASLIGTMNGIFQVRIHMQCMQHTLHWHHH